MIALAITLFLKKSDHDIDDENFLNHVEAVNKATELCKFFLQIRGFNISLNSSSVKSQLFSVKSTEDDIPKPNLDEIVKDHLEKAKEKKSEEVLFRVFITCIYIILLMVIGYKQVPLKSYHAAQTIRNAFMNNLTYVTSLDKLHVWAEKNFIPAMFDVHKYNGEELHWREQRLWALDRSMVRVGSIRWRQIRVRSQSCRQLPDVIKKCSFDVSGGKIDEQNYNASFLRKGSSKLKDEWTYLKPSSYPIIAQRHTYPTGGYIFEHTTPIPPPKDWFDAKTRAVIIESTLYNANSNLFLSLTIVIEQGMDAAITKWNRIAIIDLYPYHSTYGIVVLVCQLLFVFFVFFELYKVIKMIRKQRLAYFSSLWNNVTIVNLALSICVIVLFVVKLILRNKVKDGLKEKFVEMQHLVVIDESFTYIVAFVTGISCLKMLYVLQYNSTIMLLVNTMNLAYDPLKSLFVVFLFFLIGHAHLGYLLYISHLSSFSTMISSMYTMCIASLNSPIMRELDQARAPHRHMFYASFVLTIIVLCLNILISMLNEARACAKKLKNKNEFFLMEYLDKTFTQFWLDVKDFFCIEKKLYERMKK